MAVATSFGVLNYSGMLFNKGNTRTPLSAIIGSRTKLTDHVEFVTGQEYNAGGGSQPNISENASLTAPDPTSVTRSQATNVTQIFQETIGVSYGKMSNMGTLAGINVAGQTANPISELDFQVAARMIKVNNDIEYTFINGVYNKATTDSEVNKSRGLVPAITSNVINIGDNALEVWDVNELLTTIGAGNAPTENMALWVDANTMNQINADAVANGMTIVPAAREINGIRLNSLILPQGEVLIYRGAYLPAGTALVLNLDMIAPVIQPVPGKGNFFLEELAKTGAGSSYQLFGQIGLDHGPEWMHGKITGISTEAKKPAGVKVYVTGGTVATVETDATILSAKLNKNTVAADDTATVSVASVTYNVEPASAATLAYLWQVRAKTGTTWTDLTSSYTGYNTNTLTVKAADAEKHYRCKVTASGTATGTAYSDECDVAAAG